MKTKNKKNKIKKIKFNNVAEWLQLRKNFICASEVSVVMNHNKFKSLENLYNEKINDEKVEQTESMRWGLLLEKTIANEWALINDVKIHKKNFVYVYDDTLLATPDFFASKNKQKFLIEIKNTSKFFFEHSFEVDGIPQIYYD
ncbi:MAG: YqaJ viral recombinase family protein, partial [Leptonema sp. (in: bacteria)]